MKTGKPMCDKEIILQAPLWAGKSTICVDSCIASDIQKLWDSNVVTRGCCCGHGKNNEGPSVVVDSYDDARTAKELLQEGNLNWRILYWKLTEHVQGE